MSFWVCEFLYRLHGPPAEGALAKEFFYSPVCPCITDTHSFPGVLLFSAVLHPEAASVESHCSQIPAAYLQCSFSLGHWASVRSPSDPLITLIKRFPFLRKWGLERPWVAWTWQEGKWRYGRRCQKNILIFHTYFPTHHEILKGEK